MTRTRSHESEATLRRYAPRGPPYHIAHDRYVTPTQPEGHRSYNRPYGLSVHETPLDDPDSEYDSKASRKRIPVACGRCRKRKIRCSGPQHESSCLNCKNAGNSDCQFNRVHSEEVVFTDDGTIRYHYDTEIAQAVHCRNSPHITSYRPETSVYANGSDILPLNFALCRQHPTDYQYPTKPTSYASAYGRDFGEESPAEYALSGSSYPYYTQEHASLSSVYAPQGANRGWTPGTQQPKSSESGIYFDSDMGSYVPPQLQYGAPAYGLRSSISTEPNNFSFSGMASSLPMPSPHISHERVLPVPSDNRTSSGQPFLQRSIGRPSYSGNSTKGTNGSPTHGSPITAIINSNPMNYLSYGNSSDVSDSYTTTRLPSTIEQSQDIYNPNDNWAATLTTDPSLRAQNVPSDLHYSQGTQGSRKASRSGQGGIIATLSGNSLYQASYQPEAIQSSRNTSTDMSHAATHRHSNGSLRNHKSTNLTSP